jgi:hypothetical protein
VNKSELIQQLAGRIDVPISIDTSKAAVARAAVAAGTPLGLRVKPILEAGELEQVDEQPAQPGLIDPPDVDGQPDGGEQQGGSQQDRVKPQPFIPPSSSWPLRK